jgi:Rrf2 family protein
MFSKTCEYAIRATIYIASESSDGKRSGIKEIARKIESPEPFTAKILQRLVKANIVRSIKGNGGGFEIDKLQFKHLKLEQIVKAIDGNDLFDRCSLGLHDCSDSQPCPFHHKYKPLRENLKKTLKETTIEELLSTYNSGGTYLKL